MPDFVDSHAHIYADQFKDDIDEVLSECLDVGVNKIYMPNIDHTSIDDMMEVERRYSTHCFAMMGLHPCSVNKTFEKELYVVEEWLEKRKFIAVGEIGTDLYWDKQYFEYQKEAFKIQCQLALKHDLPIIIHCRESFDETIALVEQINDGTLRGVFHCFSGTVSEAERIINQGFYLGLGGVSTFKNSGMDKVIPELDLNHILLETDSPYLAPVPHRGKRNKPSYIPLVGQTVAMLTGKSIDEIANITTKNAQKLFKG